MKLRRGMRKNTSALMRLGGNETRGARVRSRAFRLLSQGLDQKPTNHYTEEIIGFPYIASTWLIGVFFPVWSLEGIERAPQGMTVLIWVNWVALLQVRMRSVDLANRHPSQCSLYIFLHLLHASAHWKNQLRASAMLSGRTTDRESSQVECCLLA